MIYNVLHSAAQKSESVIHTHIGTHTHMSTLLDSIPHSLQNIKFPLLHGRSLLVIYLYIVVCLCQSLYPNLSSLFPPGNYKIVRYICSSISALYISPLVSLLYISHITNVILIFVFLCLTLLRIKISRFIHVAANGIISFFLQLNNILLYILICIPVFIHSSVNGY